jgi:hypothetical protein
MPFIKNQELRAVIEIIEAATNYEYPPHKKDELYSQEVIKAQNLRVRSEIFKWLMLSPNFRKVLLDNLGELSQI